MRLTNRFNLPGPIVRAVSQMKLEKTINGFMSFEERFFSSIQFEQMSGCWLWERAMFRGWIWKDRLRKASKPAQRGPRICTSLDRFLTVILFCINVTPVMRAAGSFYLPERKTKYCRYVRQGPATRPQRRKRLHHAKLTDSDVRAIKALNGVKGCVAVAREFNISHSVISNIWSGKRWSHIQ